MALPTDKSYDLSRERGLLIVDNGATRTLTKSLFNMTNVRKEIVPIQCAGDGMSIKATHSGHKTYYGLDATGAIRPITTEAFYVPDLDQDLLSGRALVNAKYRIIMDGDPDISGLFPVVKGEIDPATGFPFAESDGLFYIETEPISESKYLSMSGYKLWHKRLAHPPHQTIKDTIPHVDGLQDLEKLKMDQHLDCASCMVGKAKLQPYPKTKEHARRPLERVYIDIASSSVKSFEGYDYALIVTDDATMYRWAYGLKTKDDSNAAIRKWVSDIVEIRIRHPLQIVIRDNAGELKSKDLIEFIEGLGSKNYYSVSYEQWQNGLAESSINSLMLLSRTQMAESGLTGKFWFRALITSVDARNATYHARIKTSLYKAIYDKTQNLSKFRALGCRAYMYLNDERRPPGKHVPRAREGINLGFATDCNTSGYMIYFPDTGKTLISNQVRFNELEYPLRKESIIDKHVESISTDILRVESAKKWVDYDPTHAQGPYKTIHHDSVSDELILELTRKPGTYISTTQCDYFQDMLKVQRAYVAKIYEEPLDVNVNKPPKSFKDAMTRTRTPPRPPESESESVGDSCQSVT